MVDVPVPSQIEHVVMVCSFTLSQFWEAVDCTFARMQTLASWVPAHVGIDAVILCALGGVQLFADFLTPCNVGSLIC